MRSARDCTILLTMDAFYRRSAGLAQQFAMYGVFGARKYAANAAIGLAARRDALRNCCMTLVGVWQCLGQGKLFDAMRCSVLEV